MKKLLFAFATLLFVACGNKVAQPEVAEEEDLSVNLPEYKLLSTEEPRVSSNGSISPGQNLVYNIEIDHVLEKDSLELLQDYFIQKGEVLRIADIGRRACGIQDRRSKVTILIGLFFCAREVIER